MTRARSRTNEMRRGTPTKGLINMTDTIAGDIRDMKKQVAPVRGDKGGTSTANGTEDRGPRMDMDGSDFDCGTEGANPGAFDHEEYVACDCH